MQEIKIVRPPKFENNEMYMAGYRRGMENCECIHPFSKEELDAIRLGLSVLINDDIKLKEIAKDGIFNHKFEERIMWLGELERKVATLVPDKGDE